MPRQCGCLGGNQNCTFCYGSGYRSGPDHDGISRERRTWEARSSTRRPFRPPPKPKTADPNRVRQKSDPTREPHMKRDHQSPYPRSMRGVSPLPRPRPRALGAGCAYCGERFNTAYALDLHIDTMHTADEKDGSDVAKSKPFVRIGNRIFERRSLKAPDRVREDRLERHLHTVHGVNNSPGSSVDKSKSEPLKTSEGLVSRSESAEVNSKALLICAPASSVLLRDHNSMAPGQTDRLLVPCPKCPSHVRKDRLARHLLDIHSTSSEGNRIERRVRSERPSNKRLRPLVHPTQSESAELSENSRPSLSEVHNHWEERRLDGSRDYWQIREAGRFGSHPSFDQCDDESAP
jgi:hypothetical protein